MRGVKDKGEREREGGGGERGRKRVEGCEREVEGDRTMNDFNEANVQKSTCCF